jgi:hypothetical protein
MSSSNVIALEHFVDNPCYEEWAELRARFSVHGPVCRDTVLQPFLIANGFCVRCPLSFRHTQLLVGEDWHGLCMALGTEDSYDSEALWNEYQGVILQKIIMFLEYVRLEEETRDLKATPR